jgi:hypothetical protein
VGFQRPDIFSQAPRALSRPRAAHLYEACSRLLDGSDRRAILDAIPPATPTILNLFPGARPMTRRNSRRFHFEFLEGRNAPSHFGAHTLIAHAVVHKAGATHETNSTLDRHDSSPNDSSNDSANDSSRDSSNDTSKDNSSRS